MSRSTEAPALMDALEARGVRFALCDGRLTIDAPSGVLTPEVRAAVIARKTAIERLVRAACGPPTVHSSPVARRPRPARRCYTCRMKGWWERPTGGWICAVCHPPPARCATVEEAHGG